MNKTNLILLGGLLTIGLSPQVLAEPVPATEHSVTSKAKKDGVVCRRVIPTGSIMPVKECRTAKSADDRAKADQESLRQFRDQGRAAVPGAD